MQDKLLPMEQISHSGWLVKKSQKRFYLLFDGKLSWFTGFKEPVGDFMKDARGSVPLNNCSVGLFPDKRTYLTISTPTDLYLVKAKSDEEAEEWFNIISRAIRAYSVAARTHNDPEIVSRHSKAGWLTFQNESKFLLVKHGFITIAKSEDSLMASDRLEIDLQQFSCTYTQHQLIITHMTDHDLVYAFSSPNGPFDLALWGKTIQSQIFGAKHQLFNQPSSQNDDDITNDDSENITLSTWFILQKTNKKKYFTVLDTLITYYPDEPQKGNAVIEGTISLVGATIAKPKTAPNMTFAIRDAQGQFIGLKGLKDQAEVDRWIDVLASKCKNASKEKALVETSSLREMQTCEGWVDRKSISKKKVTKSYLVAKGTSIKFFETQSYQSTRPEEEIYLAGCSCDRVDGTSFLLTVPQSEPVHLSVASEEESRKWINVIQSYINHANNELSKAVIKQQWLLVIGKQQALKWVVITRKRELLCFPKVSAPENIVSANAIVAIDLVAASVGKGTLNAKPSITVTAAKGGSFVFCTTDESAAQQWVEQLTTVSKGKGEIKPISLTFGVPLKDICEREGTQIPSVISQCIEFIQKNGTDQQGIFRLSGSTSEIKEYTDILDEARPITFSRNSDVHAVSGLLKLFLRSLPDPLIHAHLYAACLSTNDPMQLKAIMSHLEDINYNICTVLFHFLYKMAKYSDVTSMDSSNIAIVFGPNVLINPKSDDLHKLQDTPMILKTTKVLIDECNVIFPLTGHFDD